MIFLFVLLLYVPSQQLSMVMAGQSVHLTTLFPGPADLYDATGAARVNVPFKVHGPIMVIKMGKKPTCL